MLDEMLQHLAGMKFFLIQVQVQFYLILAHLGKL